MIKVVSAFATESRDRDRWRNRVHISIGKSGWHLTRAEAARLSEELNAVLEQTKEATFRGTLERDGNTCTLVSADGTRHQVLYSNWDWMKQLGVPVTITGMPDGNERIYMVKLEEDS